jgi:uncharacterized protein YkwD
MVSPRTALALAPALIATLALVSVPASATTPTGDSRVAASRMVQARQSTYEHAALRATNSARVRHGLGALEADECLQRFAVQQAKAMARQESMYHQDLGPIAQECAVDVVAENVAYGYTRGRELVRGWMSSPGHRANILNGDFRVVALAARQSNGGRWYAAEVFGRR